MSRIDTADMTLVSAEALEQYRLVRHDANGNAVYCDAGEFPLGPTYNYIALGGTIALMLLLNKAGTVELQSEGAVTKFADVFTAADGKIAATNSGVRVGVALGTAAGADSIIQVLPDLQRVPYVNVAASAVIGPTSTAEADFDKSIAIPASEIKAGSIFRVRAWGIVTDQDTTPQCDVRLKIGTETIATATVAAAANDDQWLIEADIVIRTIGVSGTIVAFAAVSFDAAATALGSALKASATEDTTSGLTIKCTGQFDASHADNKVRLDGLVVEQKR